MLQHYQQLKKIEQKNRGLTPIFLVTDTIGGYALSNLSTAAKGVSYYVNVGNDGSVTISTDPTSGYTKVNPTTGTATN